MSFQTLAQNNWNLPEPQVLSVARFSGMIQQNPEYLGSAVIHLGEFGVKSIPIRVGQVGQIRDWINDEKHPERGGPITLKQAWKLANFVHVSSIINTDEIGEMTQPESRRRNLIALRGSHLLICIPNAPQTVRRDTATDMTELSDARIQYPRKELVMNWQKAAKWLRKWLGHKKAAEIFEEKHRDVCSGSWFVRFRENIEEFYYNEDPSQITNLLIELRKHYVTTVTPAWLAINNTIWERQEFIKLI